MKYRSGFVSNSSSTSFIVVGRKLSAAALEGRGYHDFHSPGVVPYFVATGKELSDGVDMFEVTAEMFEVVRALVTMGERFAMYATSMAQSNEMRRLEGMLMPEHRAETHKYDLEVDNNRSQSEFDFMWRYHRVFEGTEEDDWDNEWDYLSAGAHEWIDTYTKLKEL